MAAEWAMRMLQTYWLKDRFVYEERGTGIYLKMLILLYNMRARMVGINQIRNTYDMRHLMQDANEDVFFKT